MGPATSLNNSIGFIFNFLSTPAGQQIVFQLIAINTKFLTQVGDLFNHIHGQVKPALPPAETPAPEPAK